MSEDRVVAPEQGTSDGPEGGLRPAVLDEFVGQEKLCQNLRIFIKAARARGEALDHVLMMVLLPLRRAESTFLESLGSTNGPFFTDLDMVSLPSLALVPSSDD